MKHLINFFFVVFLVFVAAECSFAVMTTVSNEGRSILSDNDQKTVKEKTIGVLASKEQTAGQSSNRLVSSVVVAVDSDSKEDLAKGIVGGLPQPPAGYAWVTFRGVAMLRPISWNQFSKGGTYSTSVESVAETGSFETGATIQVIRNVRKRFDVSPTFLTVKLIKDVKAKKENTEMLLTSNVHEDIETVVFRFRNDPEGLRPIIVHKYFMVSEKEDFVNIITFESGEAEWEDYWKEQGNTILSQLAIIPYF